MKPLFSLSQFTAVSTLTIVAALLGACGQTGPLYLPNKPPAVTVPSAPTADIPQQNSKPANTVSQ